MIRAESLPLGYEKRKTKRLVYFIELKNRGKKKLTHLVLGKDFKLEDETGKIHEMKTVFTLTKIPSVPPGKTRTLVVHFDVPWNTKPRRITARFLFEKEKGEASLEPPELIEDPNAN